MFHTLRPLAALVVMLGVVSPAAALTVHYERERFGSAPKVQEPPNADGLWVLRHGPKVVYEKEAGWSGFGQMQDEVVIAAQGGVDDVNDALTQFALIPAEERVLRLFPGPGSVYSLKGQRVACDWQIHWTSHHAFPRGERKDNTTSRTAVLTIYVARTGAIPPADPRAHGWIADLNDDRFEVRQRATGALAALGDAAIPVLRQAL
jgi:hypothetical protein